MASGTLRVRILGDAAPLEKTLGGLGGKLAGFAKAATLAAAVATGVSIKKFADFDQAMQQSVAIMGNVSDKMRGDMSDAAREVAKTTVFSAEEAAESYFFLASAGFDAAQSIEALPRVAAFAQAGNFDMARATDLLTDSQSALGLASDDTAENLQNLSRVGDVLVKANTLANASVEQFSEALTEKAGNALQALGKDVEEGVAVLSVFADQGIKGSAAGTMLTNTLEGLTRNARENAGEFENLGVQVFNADGSMRGTADIVRDLEGAMGDMSVEEREATLAKMGFNKQALTGIKALLGNSEALDEYESQLREAGGTVDDIAGKQLETFNAQLGLLKDQFLDVALSVGQQLMPHMMRFVEIVKETMPAVQAFAENSLAAVGNIIENVVMPAVRVLGDWWAANGPQIVSTVQTIADAVAGFVAGALRKMADWWSDNGPTIIDAAQRIAAVVQDVLVAAFDKLSGWWDTNGAAITSAVEKLADGVVTAFSKLADAAEFVRDNWNAIWPVLQTIGAVIVTLLIPHYVALGIAAVVSSAKQVVAWVMNSTAALRHGAIMLWSLAKVVAGWAASAAAAAVSAAKTVATLVWLAAQYAVLGVKALAAAAKVALSWIIAMGPIALVIAAVVGLVVLIVKNWDKIKEWTSKAWAAVTATVSKAWKAITGAVSRAVTSVVNFFRNLGDRVRALASALFTFYVAIWRTIISTVVGAVSAFVSRIVNFFSNIRDRIASAAQTARSRVVDAFRQLVSGVRDRVSSLVATVTRLPGRILRALGNTGRMLFNAGKNVIRGLIDGVRSMIGNIGSAISDAAAQVTRFWPFSPAKEGPLRKHPPEKAGANIIGLMADGMAANLGQIAAQADAAARAALIPMLDQTGDVRPGRTTGLPSSRTSTDETNRLLRELLAELRRGGDVYLDSDKVGRTLVGGIRSTQGGWR